MGRAVLKEVETGATVVALPGAKPGVVPLPAPPRKPISSRLLPWLRTILVNVLPPLVTVALIALFWQIAAAGPQSSLPPPTKIWEEAKDLIVEPFYWAGSQDIGLGWRILVSLQRVAPLFQVLRTVQPLAWLPLSLAGFQDSNPSAIFVIFITAIWPVIINTAVGIRNIPQDYRNVAQVLRLNQVEFFFKIMVPSAAPYIFTGLRIGVGLSWLAIVAAEMLTGGVGIGFFIWDAWNSSRLSDIIVALIYIGVVGFVLDRLVALTGSIVTRGTLTH
ncbi:MAG: nitrate ABC transporter, permease protein [Bosea sp. 32-68-6]|nr:MAG: nitrate ABC transporter, permease protein [Bosea sp. 32-68-6]